MAIRIEVDPELQAQWLPILERQIDLTLAPVAMTLKRARIRFSAFESEGTGDVRYLCELQGRGEDGVQLHFRALHRDGQTAIHDTAARARRAIAHRRQHKAANRVPAETG